MKSKPSLPPGFSPEDAAPAKNASAPMSKAAKKNAKRKEKKHQQKESEGAVQGITQSMTQANISSKQDSNKQTQPPANTNNEDSDKHEVLKKVRTLRKKLKQIEDLERRIESGELKEPEKEQLEKISKKQAIVDEMEELQLELED